MQMAEDIATLKKEFAQVTESVKLLEADANAASTSMDEATLRKTISQQRGSLTAMRGVPMREAAPPPSAEIQLGEGKRHESGSNYVI